MGLERMGTRNGHRFLKSGNFLKEAGLLRVVIIVIRGKFFLSCCAFSSSLEWLWSVFFVTPRLEQT